MPSYDYVCQDCGHQFERFQKMSDPPERRCPKCGGRVKRKIGPGAGIIFKGSGFYATDYRSSDYKAKESAERGSAPSPSEKKTPEKKKTAAGTDHAGT
jgi:putative FmdB family regulatory protein